MKYINILLLSLFIYICSFTSVGAFWYGNHGVAYVNSSVTNCTDDGDLSGTPDPTYGESAASQGNSSSSLIPESSTNPVTPSSGTLYCLYWDGASPTADLSYNSGLFGTGQTITVEASDTGGSKLKKIELYERMNSGAYTQVQAWDNLNTSTLTTRTWTRTPVEGDTYDYKTIVYDYSGNATTVTGTNTLTFDTTAPTVNDIINIIPTNGTVINTATFSNSFTISNNGGVQIASMKVRTIDSNNVTNESTISGANYIQNGLSASGITYYIVEVLEATDGAGNTGVFYPSKYIYYYPINVTSTGATLPVSQKKQTEYQAYTLSNYNNEFLVAFSGGMDYVYALPSLITTLGANTTLTDIGDNDAFVFNKYGNLPHTFDSSTGGLSFTPSDYIVYSKPSDEKISMMDIDFIAQKLKQIYGDSVFKDLTVFQDIVTEEKQNALREDIQKELAKNGISIDMTTKSSLWKNIDSQCLYDDIVINGKIWAGCNSRMGSGIDTFSSTECYDYAGNTIACSNTESGNKESDLLAGQSSYIWGKLYSGAEMNSACPTGWKVPTNDDWLELEAAIGCEDSSSSGWRCNRYGWYNTIQDSKNIKTVLKTPLSGQASNGNLTDRGLYGNYWTSTVNPSNSSENYVRQIASYIPFIYSGFQDTSLYNSVRCIAK